MYKIKIYWRDDTIPSETTQPTWRKACQYATESMVYWRIVHSVEVYNANGEVAITMFNNQK